MAEYLQEEVDQTLIFYKGKVVCIETKRPNGTNKPTPLQLYNLEKRIKAGAIGMVAFTLEDVKKVIEEIEEKDIWIMLN